MSRERPAKTRPPSPEKAAPRATSEAGWEAEANRVAWTFVTSEGPARPPSPEDLTRARNGEDAEPAGVRSLPSPLRGRAEALLGHDFSGVRLRTGVGSLGTAHAETSADEIRLAPGRYRPDHPLGRALLVHELTHVAQQGAAPRRLPRPPGGFAADLEGRRTTAGSALLAAERRTVAEPLTAGVTPAPRGLRQRCDGEPKTQTKTEGAPEAGTDDAGTPPPTPQPPAPDPAQEVANVKSLRIEDSLAPAQAKRSATTQTKIEARRKAIQTSLDGGATGAYAEKLRRDLGKSLEQTLATKDEVANPDLRNDIVKAVAAEKTGATNLEGSIKAFHRFDETFAGAEVTTALAGSGFTPADLKALVSQESGDLGASAENDTEGDIRGIAQLGASAAQAVGSEPGDRTDPKKAIVIAAKYLALNAKNLSKQLSPVPQGEELKKFVIASYNAGPLTIRTAQQKAIGQKRTGDQWSQIVDPAKGAGIDTTPLHKAWTQMKADIAALSKIDPNQKYRETKEYVERIYRRLGK